MPPPSPAPPATMSDKCLPEVDTKVSSAERLSPVSPSLSPGFYPQTPTLSTPDTPTTAGPTSPGPWTPNTPSFGPLSPGYADTKNGEELDVPAYAPPKDSLLFYGAARAGAQRGDLHEVTEEEGEGQELVIPEPRVALCPLLHLHLSPPRLNVQKSQATLAPTRATGDLYHEAFDSNDAEIVNAFKSDAFSPSTTTVGDSFETGIFEMLTPTQEEGAFNLIEPALAEKTSSTLCPLPATPPPRPASYPADRSPPTSTASDNPSSVSSERPLVVRRHRPPPVSVSQDLSGLVRRFHMFQGYFRHRENHAAAGPSPTPVRMHAYERPDNHDLAVDEARTHDSDIAMTTMRSATLPPVRSGPWFPPSGSDSPVRFIADSPASMMSIPPPPQGELIRRHRPLSMRSISPMHISDSVETQHEHSLASVESGFEGLQEVHGRASDFLFPLPPTRGHRRQLAVSVSFRNLGESDSDRSARRNSLSPPPLQHIEGPQLMYSRWDSTTPDIVFPGLRNGSIDGAQRKRGGQASHSTKKKSFWNILSVSATGLFSRKDKAADFDALAPKKRVRFTSLRDIFRRRERETHPRPCPVPETAHLEVWPPPQRRTSTCSDPTCLFHPHHPTTSLATMSFATSPTTSTTTSPPFDLGDPHGTFLAELGNWGGDETFGAWEFGESPENQRVSAETSGVREEGERVLQDILNISGGARGKTSSSS